MNFADHKLDLTVPRFDRPEPSRTVRDMNVERRLPSIYSFKSNVNLVISDHNKKIEFFEFSKLPDGTK